MKKLISKYSIALLGLAIVFGIYGLINGWASAWNDLNQILNKKLSEISLGELLLSLYFLYTFVIKQDIVGEEEEEEKTEEK